VIEETVPGPTKYGLRLRSDLLFSSTLFYFPSRFLASHTLPKLTHPHPFSSLSAFDLRVLANKKLWSLGLLAKRNEKLSNSKLLYNYHII
jgi:hypothetical protein